MNASRRRAVLIGLLTSGLVLILVGWVRVGSDYWPSLALELGSGLLLVAALFHLDQRLREATRGIGTELDDLGRRVRGIHDDMTDISTTLANLRSLSRALVKDEYDKIFRDLDGWEDTLDFYAVWRPLVASRDLGAISAFRGYSAGGRKMARKDACLQQVCNSHFPRSEHVSSGNAK
jgi:hypothetical protein